MHGILTQTHKTSAVKYQNDRILSYFPRTSATFQDGSDRVITINPGPKSWTAPTTAVAMVIIALATLVGGGMTTWHYWNVEKRAAQAEQQTAWQGQMDWWKGEMQRAEAGRQQHRQLDEARAKARRSALAAMIPSAQVQETTENRGASTGLIMLSGPSTTAFSVADSGQPK